MASPACATRVFMVVLSGLAYMMNRLGLWWGPGPVEARAGALERDVD